MKIDLDYPFNIVWKAGYLVTNKENRRMLCLFNSKQDRTTISFARYLVSVKEKRFLESNEHVDHIDNDPTNDSLNNLQILSPTENNRKSHKKGETMYSFVCPVCHKDFQLSARQSHKKTPTCSRRCGGIKSHWKS